MTKTGPFKIGNGDPGEPGEPYTFLLVDVHITTPASGALLGSGVQVAGTASCTLVSVAADGTEHEYDAVNSISSVKVKFGGGSYLTASKQGSNWSNWTRSYTTGVSGSLTVTAKVTASDASGTYERTASVTVEIDSTDPALAITGPLEGTSVTWAEGGVPVLVEGTASDTQSGIAAVDWSLDGGGYSSVTPASPGNYSTWHKTVTLPSDGDHLVTVRARDQLGNETFRTLHLSAVVTFEPGDPENVVSLAAYLADLLDFTENRVTTANGSAIGRQLLADTFHQSFDTLKDVSVRAVADQVVPQVRISTEVLHKYLTAQSVTVAAEALDDYRFAAYKTLLRQVGTSYDELRLARVADAKTRKALADRLGISLSASRPDPLDNLLLDPASLTEADLELLFGLRETASDPLTEGVVPEAQLLTWRLAHLRSLWQQYDAARSTAEDGVPLIDPDVIGQEDFRVAILEDSAYSLWDARRQWVEAELSQLRATREAEATALAGFDAVVSSVLGPVASLLDLYAQHQEGEDVEPTLADRQLGLAPFLYLLRMRELAESGTVLETEWDDVDSILVEVRKIRERSTWVSEETAANVILGPDSFVQATAVPELPRWRATAKARRAWSDTLQSRIRQEKAVVEALRSAVVATEEATLPALRDAMVAAAYPNLDPLEAANRLTVELAIDAKSSGVRRTTRLNQGIATLQGILFSLRTERFNASHPAAAWDLDLADFDEAWSWMGAYANWRGAMMVFGYPENYLLPALREHHLPNQNPTQAFADLVARLRELPRLSPAQARAEAAAYLADVRSELTLPTALASSSFVITEDLTEAQLQTRRGFVAGFFTDPDPHLAPNYLKEIFYFVPMLLALQLQKLDQYVVALDWYQTVYSYNQTGDKRKIYHGLLLEESIDTQYQRHPDWPLEGLNPHDVAVDRQNAYTRFTLISLLRCFLEFANAEFTRDTAESVPRARALYVTALGLFDTPELQPPAEGPFPPNPVLQALRFHIELNLFKLRSGLNIAGMKRQGGFEVPQSETVSGLTAIGSGGELSLPQASSFQPTPYRYTALVERAKQLVAIAQQIEGAYLAALEKYDAESYNLLKARQDLELTRAGVTLQELRVDEAEGGVRLAELQRERSLLQAEHYQDLLDEGLSGLEQSALGFMATAAFLQTSAGFLHGAGALLDTARSIVTLGLFGDPAGQAAQVASSLAAAASTTGSMTQTLASYERREQDWRFQLDMTQHDLLTGDQQIVIAQDHVRVVGQEHEIAQMQAEGAAETLDFLANKFTSAELYEWMGGILGGVYSYFLQQATALARLAERQLAFERQQNPAACIRADYWELPAEGAAVPNPNESAADRRGMTGSARLLRDIYQLDQYAFETNKRKLQLSQTLSLAQLAPAEFQRFRETGVLSFATPMELFDRAFPGQYLRLVKRVRTSVIALIPPTQGIRATLTASGLSRVVVGGEGFQTLLVRRDPEQVALTSPINATGLFELQPEGELLLPFEGMGVDTSWELQMPRAANPFDFTSLADVLVTIEYTAHHSGEYRRQVVERLDRRLSGDRPFSFRHQLADPWYDLHNPDQSAEPMVVRFQTKREDFPPNLDELKIQQVLLYVSRSNGESFELPVDNLSFTPAGESTSFGGAAATVDAVVSTRRSSGTAWLGLLDRTPVGDWELALPDTVEVRDHFRNGEVEDLLLVLTYEGQTPAWPA